MAAWVLNLDSDLELAGPQGYAPKERVLRAMRPHVERAAATLLGPDDVLIDETTPPNAARGLVGRAWSPTPRAIRLLLRAGAEPVPHPSLDVLRRVTSRAFSSALGETLPAGEFIEHEHVALAKLDAPPPVGDGWRVKRAFGMAGREHRIVEPKRASAADVGFVRAAIAEGGARIEPNVSIVREYGIHGFVFRDRSISLGALVLQRTDAHGAWLGTDRVGAGEEEEEACARLRAEGERVAKALAHEGYTGPFGVDAFTWRDRDVGVALNPRSEVNARYTMGFAVGFGRPP